MVKPRFRSRSGVTSHGAWESPRCVQRWRVMAPGTRGAADFIGRRRLSSGSANTRMTYSDTNGACRWRQMKLGSTLTGFTNCREGHQRRRREEDTECVCVCECVLAGYVLYVHIIHTFIVLYAYLQADIVTEYFIRSNMTRRRIPDEHIKNSGRYP